ncbi:MAG: PEGA domain-containing protein [Candidatus Saccharibacteria bacterium]|nr:PEGA domain-containing protein [Candidatus Saccharibacteria bacterium]
MPKKTIFTTAIILIVVTLVAYGFILYGKGYRLNLSGEGNKIIAGTGLLVLTSAPNGARVYIDDSITTATDDTINLPPGEYDVRIEKDGYYPWKKHVTLKNEAVTKTDAVLFPVAPKLEAVTLLGAEKPVIDPTGSLIGYTVSSSSAENNGIYVLNLGSRFIIPFGTSARQIADDSVHNFSKASIEFSPDGREVIATVSTLTQERMYLLKSDTLNVDPQDITLTSDEVRTRWEDIQKQLDQEFATTLPTASRKFILSNFAKAKLSPEGDKILYVASQSATMPFFINPTLPSTNSTQETRNIKQGAAYVYQVKEDKNYLLYEPQANEILPQFIWHPSSAHVVFVQNKRIFSLEYDGGNKTTLYAGPFDPDFLFTWPDGSGLIILANFNDETIPGNLYKVGLR